MMKRHWNLNWRGKTCVVLASGHSAASTSLDRIKGKVPLIAVNDSWKLAPWADVLYACDNAWWIAHEGVPDFYGIKISSGTRAVEHFPEISRVRLQGNNSGLKAMELAAHYGASKIVLVGFDMGGTGDGHWHADHRPPLRNRTGLEVWREETDRFAKRFAAREIQVVNTSMDSALTRYEKVPFDTVFPDASDNKGRANRARHSTTHQRRAVAQSTERDHSVGAQGAEEAS